MAHEHSISCLQEGPGGSLVCNVTGESTAKPPTSTTPPAANRAPASLRRDRLTGRLWLMFVSRPAPNVVADLKAGGWRWSGFRKEWHHPSRYTKIPASIEATDEGFVDYASERGERLEERAGKHTAKSETAHRRFESISSGIPLGQPILVGHHSERHHRRDIARMESALGKAVEHGREAERLHGAAGSSERHQAYIQSAPVIQRRLDRLRADLRSMEKTFGRAAYPGQEWTPNDRTDYERRMQIKRQEITETEQTLAEAGGPPPSFDIGPGDLVRAKGRLYRVESAGPKNFIGTVLEGGAAGMKLKIGREDLQEITQKSKAPPPPKPKQEGGERGKMIRFIYGKKPADYRGRTEDGKHSVMSYASEAGGTHLIVLENLTDSELRARAEQEGYTGAPRKTKYDPADRLAVLREVSSQGIYAKKTVEGAKLTGLIARTALQVHDHLPPEGQSKFLNLPMPRLIDIVLRSVHGG